MQMSVFATFGARFCCLFFLLDLFSSSCWPKLPSLPVWSPPYLQVSRQWEHQHTVPRSLSVSDQPQYWGTCRSTMSFGMQLSCIFHENAYRLLAHLFKFWEDMKFVQMKFIRNSHSL
jgi:hypothetical protein